tara:strand:- start:51 stop:1568 length:1518 start_codon:yes stop_codon:yes gene_type:complete
MNDEYDPNAIIEEAMGPDEDDDEGISAYALNRQKLNQSRNIDPDRFKNQMDTIQKFIDPSDPQFMTELLLDMKTGYSAAQKAPGGPLVKGGAAAGAIALRRMGGKYIDDMLDSIIPEGPITVFAMSGTGGKKRPPNFSTTGTFGRARYYNSPDHTNKIMNELVNTWKMKDGIFDFDQYEIMRPKVVPSKSRLFGELFESPAYTKVDFNIFQRALVQGPQGLRSKYASIIDNLGFPQTKFQLHHTVPIKGSLPGYDGLRFGSNEWWDVTEILFRNMLRPGNDAFNLVALVGGNKPTTILKNGIPTKFPTPHSVTHKFLDNKIGPSGELFWTKEVRKKMKADFAYRKEKWQEYAEIVKKSQDITNQAEFTFRDLFEKVPADQLDDELDLLVERLVQLDNDGLLNVKKVDGNYQVPQMADLVTEIKEEMLESEADAALRAVVGREGLLADFVKRQQQSQIDLRKLSEMNLADQLKELEKSTGMSVEDLQLLIQTQPNFDIIKFMKEYD